MQDRNLTNTIGISVSANLSQVIKTNRMVVTEVHTLKCNTPSLPGLGIFIHCPFGTPDGPQSRINIFVNIL